MFLPLSQLLSKMKKMVGLLLIGVAMKHHIEDLALVQISASLTSFVFLHPSSSRAANISLAPAQ